MFFGFKLIQKTSFLALNYAFLSFIYLNNLYTLCEARTHNPEIKSHMLFQLSHLVHLGLYFKIMRLRCHINLHIDINHI